MGHPVLNVYNESKVTTGGFVVSAVSGNAEPSLSRPMYCASLLEKLKRQTIAHESVKSEPGILLVFLPVNDAVDRRIIVCARRPL